MWHRKELKARGKQVFRRNLWAAIAVCFILAFTGAEFADSVSFIRDFSAASSKPDSAVVVQRTAASNWDTVLGWLSVDPADGAHPLWAAAALRIVTQGMFINRGTMFGPWLPIYGAGGVLVLVLLKKLFKNPVATFFVSMVLCSVIEYCTSWYLEFTKGVRWWDYSGYFMNLNGRICLEGAVVFGLGCCAVVYFAGPALGALIDRLSPARQNALCAVLLALFTADAAYSHFHPNAGRGITDYGDWQGTDAPAAQAAFSARASARPALRAGTSRFR